MPTQETIYEVANRVATITLNRPDKLNAWTATMEKEVRASLEEAERDDKVGIIVLTGAGRGFCAGADMSLLSSVATQGLPGGGGDAVSRLGGAPQRQGVRSDFQKKYSYLLGIEKPILAAINGPAVGLGLVIALYCDLRLASEAARFSTTFAQRGLIAEYGMAWMLPLDNTQGARTNPRCEIDSIFVDLREEVLMSEALIHQAHAQSFSRIDLPGGK